MTPVYDEAAVVAFVAARDPGRGGNFGDCSAIGWAENGKLVAGAVYHEWNPARRMIEVSAASDCRRWMTWPMARLMFGYPFTFCDLVYARSEVPVVQRAWRLLGGEIHRTPVWTICTLTKEAAHGRLALGS